VPTKNRVSAASSSTVELYIWKMASQKNSLQKGFIAFGYLILIAGIGHLVGSLFGAEGATFSNGLVGTAIGYLAVRRSLHSWFAKRKNE